MTSAALNADNSGPNLAGPPQLQSRRADPFGLIARYLFRNLALSTLVLTAGLSFAIWLTQSLKFLELAVNGATGLRLFLTIVMLTLPSSIAVILPIALLLVILFIYNKLTMESELIVLRAAGLSHWALARPAVVLGIIVAIAVFVLNAWIAPNANRTVKNILEAVRSGYGAVLLRDGVFNTLSERLTVYVGKRQANGELQNLVIHQEPADARAMTFFCKRGVLVDDPRPRMLVYECTRSDIDAQSGRVNTLTFDRYAVDIDLVQEQTQERFREASERTLWELFNAGSDEEVLLEPRIKRLFLAEAHARLSSPFYALAFCGIALAAMLSGAYDRRGQLRRILFASLIALAVQACAMGLSNLARISGLAVPLLYVSAALPAILGAALLHRGNGGRLGPLDRLLPRRGRAEAQS
jgi:lipopolysaccharide export system permease protein